MLTRRMASCLPWRAAPLCPAQASPARAPAYGGTRPCYTQIFKVSHMQAVRSLPSRPAAYDWEQCAADMRQQRAPPPLGEGWHGALRRAHGLPASLISRVTATRDPLTAEVRVQELAQCLNMGALPRSMVVLLQDELVDRCKAGGVDTAAQHNAAELMPCCPAALHCCCASALDLA